MESEASELPSEAVSMKNVDTENKLDDGGKKENASKETQISVKEEKPGFARLKSEWEINMLIFFFILWKIWKKLT